MSDATLDPLTARVRERDPAALAAFLERRRPALLAFVEHRLGSALRGKLEPQDVLQELAVKALHDLPRTDLSARDPFGWLCQLAEQCIVDDHRHFAAGKRAAGREVPGSAPVGDGSQDLIALLAASMTTLIVAVAAIPATAPARSARFPSLIAPDGRLPLVYEHDHPDPGGRP